MYITTYDDAVADKDNFNGPHRVIGSAGLASSKTDGSIRKMPNGDFYIMFRGIPSRTKMLETLAHELGHLHQKEAFENAIPSVNVINGLLLNDAWSSASILFLISTS